MRKSLIFLLLFFFMGFGLALSPSAWANLITGVELNDSFDANSTNELNYNSQAPGRPGQPAPFVLFDSNDAGHVTLEFNNPSTVNAYFEYRIDGVVLTSGTSHYFITGDYVYPWLSRSSGSTPLLQTFTASDMVEIRSAFGPENDWYFDWTAFSVAEVPIPGAVWLLGCGLVGLVGLRRKIKN